MNNNNITINNNQFCIYLYYTRVFNDNINEYKT